MGDAGRVTHRFNTLLKRLAEQTKNDKFLQVTPHTLRHTWATLAARAGFSMYQIAGVLGDTVSTVERNYLKHSPDHLRDAVNF
jgi:integrase